MSVDDYAVKVVCDNCGKIELVFVPLMVSVAHWGFNRTCSYCKCSNVFKRFTGGTNEQ